MNLKDALLAAAPVVGDGKLIPQHAYVLAKSNILHATDGQQWVEILLDLDPATPDFCVRYVPLCKALERDHTAMDSDNDNGLIIKYGRGRARLRGTDPNTFPVLTRPPPGWTKNMPDGFQNRIKDLMTFCANSDGHVWQQAVHMHADCLIAANSFALAKCLMDFEFEDAIGIPTWACKFVANMQGMPPALHHRGQMLSFTWPQVTLFTTLLTQEIPDNILQFAHDIAEPTIPVPEGLKEAVERINGHGGKTCRIGNGEIIYNTDAVELVDDLEVNGAPKTWGVDTLTAALEHATKIDLSNGNATWAGEGYVGIFSGRSD